MRPYANTDKMLPQQGDSAAKEENISVFKFIIPASRRRTEILTYCASPGAGDFFGGAIFKSG